MINTTYIINDLPVTVTHTTESEWLSWFIYNSHLDIIKIERVKDGKTTTTSKTAKHNKKN